ncbi:MAG TPA: hypothetical protein VLX56_04570 [Nitrososphaerales archaeon]|nr:hypothetical protein [Nitrososphaerales archaeon]
MKKGVWRRPAPRTNPPKYVPKLFGSLNIMLLSALTSPRCSAGKMLIEKESVSGPDMFISAVLTM